MLHHNSLSASEENEKSKQKISQRSLDEDEQNLVKAWDDEKPLEGEIGSENKSLIMARRSNYHDLNPDLAHRGRLMELKGGERLDCLPHQIAF